MATRTEAGEVFSRLCEALDEPRTERIGHQSEHDWQIGVHQRGRCERRASNHQIRTSVGDYFRGSAYSIWRGARPVIIDFDITANIPASLLEAIFEGSDFRLSFNVTLCKSTHQDCNTSLQRRAQRRYRGCRPWASSYRATR